jgi:hypothetical protein
MKCVTVMVTRVICRPHKDEQEMRAHPSHVLQAAAGTQTYYFFTTPKGLGALMVYYITLCIVLCTNSADTAKLQDRWQRQAEDLAAFQGVGLG